MLEVKAKDQGRKRKCSLKKNRSSKEKKQKKGLQKFFSGDLKKGLQKKFSGDLYKKRSRKIFSADLQNFNHSKNSAVLELRTGQFSRT